MTVTEALRQAAERLTAAGLGTAALDAERLLRHVTGWDRARVVVEGGAPLRVELAAAFWALVVERAKRRPLQHLTGIQAFWRHEFRVTPDALVPRPETETLVEAALERLRGRVRPVVVDVGTGSGCIALSLAGERPDAEVHAIDLSEAALAVARDNARRLGLEGRVAFHHGDLLAPVARLAGRVDLVASNPPYVDAAEWPALEPEVRDHEPRMALVPPEGRDSLYARLTAAAARTLGPGGFLLLEIGQGMEADVVRLCRGAGLAVERVIPDLQGIPRTVVASHEP